MKLSCQKRLILSGSLLVGLATTAVSKMSDAGEFDYLVPAYYGETGESGPWEDMQAFYPNNGVRSMIIVNPDNGPGTSRDNVLEGNMADMNDEYDHQPKFIGYVDMPATYDVNGNAVMVRSTSDILTDVDNWFAFYNSEMNGAGLFFDDVERQNPPSNLPQWSSADLPQIEYVVSTIFTKYQPKNIVMNAAGAYSTTQGLFYCVGNIVSAAGSQLVVVTMETYEGDINTHASDFALGGALHWVYNYPATYFAGLVHNGTVSGAPTDIQTLVSYNMSLGFVTDQPQTPNPWDPGPTWPQWEAMEANMGNSVSYTFPGGTSGGLSFDCPPPHS